MDNRGIIKTGGSGKENDENVQTKGNGEEGSPGPASGSSAGSRQTAGSRQKHAVRLVGNHVSQILFSEYHHRKTRRNKGSLLACESTGLVIE